MKKKLKKLTPLISIIFFGFALWFLDRELRQYELAEVLIQLSQIPNVYFLIADIVGIKLSAAHRI